MSYCNLICKLNFVCSFLNKASMMQFNSWSTEEVIINSICTDPFNCLILQCCSQSLSLISFHIGLCTTTFSYTWTAIPDSILPCTVTLQCLFSLLECDLSYHVTTACEYQVHISWICFLLTEAWPLSIISKSWKCF